MIGRYGCTSELRPNRGAIVITTQTIDGQPSTPVRSQSPITFTGTRTYVHNFIKRTSIALI